MGDTQDRETLKYVSLLLARVHKALVDNEMDQLEKQSGHAIAPTARLGLLLEDTRFEWLRTLSGLMAYIDEVSFQKEPVTEEQFGAIGKQLKAMFVDRTFPEFSQQYFSLLPMIPDLFVEHGRLRAAILDWAPN